MDGAELPCRTCGVCCRDTAGARYVSEDEARAIGRLGHSGFSMHDPYLGFRSLKSENGACVFFDPVGAQRSTYVIGPSDYRGFVRRSARARKVLRRMGLSPTDRSLFALPDDERELAILERTALPSFADDLPAYAEYTDSMLARYPDREYRVLRPVALRAVSGKREVRVSPSPLPAGFGSLADDR